MAKPSDDYYHVHGICANYYEFIFYTFSWFNCSSFARARLEWIGCGERIDFTVKCNGLFEEGQELKVPIVPSSLEILDRCHKHFWKFRIGVARTWAVDLYIAEVMRRRPRKGRYPPVEEFHYLFDLCGPEEKQ